MEARESTLALSLAGEEIDPLGEDAELVVAGGGDPRGEVALRHPLHGPIDEADIREDGARRDQDAGYGEGGDAGRSRSRR